MSRAHIGSDQSESAILRAVMLRMSQQGARMFRNNCGQLQDVTGRWVRYGVANPGGSDLIGWTPHVVTAADVGRTIAIFTAVEVKTATGRTIDEQDAFLTAVVAAGGIGRVVRSAAECG